MATIRKVLTIDGGGIRGIIPATILGYIEEQTGRSVSETFDLIGGTSTGGILALALATPSDDGTPRYSADDIVDLYETEGSTIFSRSFWNWLKSLGNLVDAKYPADGIEKVLDNYFGASRLRDALTEVIITGYDLEERHPWFFRSRRAKDPQQAEAYDFPMKVVARATSAAPTYFDPKKIEGTGGSGHYALVDGGVFANNPSMCSYIEAKTIYPGDEIMMVSLGTGHLTRRIPYSKAKNWGLAEWAKPIIDVVFDGVADTISFQLQQLLSEDRYYRFQTQLSEDQDSMDDASEENIRMLKNVAETLVSEEKDRLDDLVERLK